MKYLKQFFIILLISFLGEVCAKVLPLPVPGSIYGIVLMFTGLCTGVIRLSSVKETARFLVELMPCMFIPAAVGLLDSFSLIKGSLLQYGIMILVTTIGVMAAAGLVTQAVMRKGGKKDE